MTVVFEMMGSILGLFGCLLIATNTKYSKYGWVICLGANFCMIAFAYQVDAKWLLVQQLGFCVTSGVGMLRVGSTRAVAI